MTRKINLVKGLGIDLWKEIFIDPTTVPIPIGTHSIKKVLSRFNCYNWEGNKVGSIPEALFNELWNIPDNLPNLKEEKDNPERTEEDYLEQGQWE